MIIVLLLGIHFLLLSIYAIAIEFKLSRHQFKYLIFAALVPVAGVVCLLVTEFVKTKSEYDNNNMFRYLNRDTVSNTVSNELEIDNISRESLILAIERRPINIVNILKKALLSDDVEVVHVAAASIMKIQRDYENKIKDAMLQYEQTPNNMDTLKNCVCLIGKYYDEKILNGASEELLLQQQESLLLKLINVLPEDLNTNISLANNYYLQKKYDKAIDVIEKARKYYNENYDIWKLRLMIKIKQGNRDEIIAVIKEAEYIKKQWNNNSVLWWEKECSKIAYEK